MVRNCCYLRKLSLKTTVLLNAMVIKSICYNETKICISEFFKTNLSNQFLSNKSPFELVFLS